MINEDTIYLLRECNAGTQMAVYSIGEILENVKDQKLREILISSKNHHEQLGNELHILLQKYGDTTKDPGVIAKGMSWIKTNAKLAIDDSDRVCADLITDGCHMGTKTMQRHISQRQGRRTHPHGRTARMRTETVFIDRKTLRRIRNLHQKLPDFFQHIFRLIIDGKCERHSKIHCADSQNGLAVHRVTAPPKIKRSLAGT